MILAAKKILIVIEFARNADFVASGAKLRRAHERLEEGLLVKLRLSLDQLPVDVLEDAVGAVSERIMNRLVNRVVRIAPSAVDVRDRMAGRASDARLRRRIMHIIEMRIIKSAAEKRYDVMATGAPARRFHVAVAFDSDLPGLTDAEEVRFIVE